MKITLIIICTIIINLAPSAQGVSSPEEFIRNIYTSEHLPWATEKSSHVIDFSSRKSLAKYFDNNLVNLFIRDDKYKIKTKEIGCLDFDPIYDAQDGDPVTKDLKISKVVGKVNVFSVTFANLGTRTLIYKLTYTADGWRIKDIEYSKNKTLTEILSCKHE